MQRVLLKVGEKRQLILLLQMTSVFCLGGLSVVKPAWLLLTHFNAADAGAWLIAGVLLASFHLCISSCTHKEHVLGHMAFWVDISQVLRQQISKHLICISPFKLCCKSERNWRALFRYHNSLVGVTVCESLTQTFFAKEIYKRVTVNHLLIVN